jgi:hypothetical protein
MKPCVNGRSFSIAVFREYDLTPDLGTRRRWQKAMRRLATIDDWSDIYSALTRNGEITIAIRQEGPIRTAYRIPDWIE